jgi:hypothetical protein
LDGVRAVKFSVVVERSGDSLGRISFRFPSGDYEVTYMQQAPKDGDVVFRRGRPWLVESAEREDGATVIRLEVPDEEARG